MMARLVPALPEGAGWIYEVKLDGYRAMLSKRGADIRLRSRNDKDLSAAYPEVMAAARTLRPSRVLLDGEIVAVGPDGLPSFQALQHRSLRFAGKVRAGFTPLVRRQVHAQLRRRHARVCPFVDLPNSRTSHRGAGVTAEQMHEMQWLEPTAVAQIRFVEWTAEGHLRHAAFLGMRTDVGAGRVRREGT